MTEAKIRGTWQNEIKSVDKIMKQNNFVDSLGSDLELIKVTFFTALKVFGSV